MTVDEAMRSLESNGPADGDWKTWRSVRLEATTLLEEVSAQTLERFIPRLRAVCVSSQDSEAQRAAALPLVRWCVERQDFTEAVSLAKVMTYNRSLFDAIGRAAELGLEVWPLVLALIPEHEPEQLLSQLLHPDKEHAAKRLAQLPPVMGMKVAWQLGVWKRAPLAVFADTIIATYLRETGEAKKAAASALTLLAAQPAPIPLAVLEERLTTESGEEAALISWVLSVQGRHVELLRDPRAHVRRGAIEALSRGVREHPERWQLLLRAALDPDPMVRTKVLELAREGIEAGLPFDPVLAPEFLSRPELDEFLSFVVTKHPHLRSALREGASAGLSRTLEAPTRACARCRCLPREKSWGHESDQPRLAVLELVALLAETDCTRETLLRCAECWAHYVHSTWWMVDVNSLQTDSSLRRLKLRELKEKYGKHFDASHPRVASWSAALEADLQHVEAAVRAEALWELGE